MTQYLLSASYEGEGLHYWFYDDSSDTIVKKHQRVLEKELGVPEHHSYLLTFDGFPIDGAQVIGCDQVEKYYALVEQKVTLNRALVSNPTVVFDYKTQTGLRTQLKTSYEDDITYILRAIWDYHLVFGLPGKRVDYPQIDPPIGLNDKVKFEKILSFYRSLLETPPPKLKRVALDIEVKGISADDTILGIDEEFSEPKEADEPVVCVSLAGSDNFKAVLILKRFDYEKPGGYMDNNGIYYQIFDTEKEMLEVLFKMVSTYPVVLTFWGDQFDCYYLYQRSKKLGIAYEKIPIRLNFSKKHKSLECRFVHAIHIDMNKLLTTRFLLLALKCDKLMRHGLEDFANKLLNKHKLPMPDFKSCTIEEMARYCLNDSILTLELSQFDSDKTLNLAIVISRFANIPIEDSTRKSTSYVLRNHFKWLHTVLGYLIPNQNDFNIKRQIPVHKSEFSDEKYMGAFIIQPKPGIHFDVHVLDFASLYASVVDIKNLSYETVVCGHEECKDNIAAFQTYYICKRNRGILSLTIGAIRYLRVFQFKKGKTPWDKVISEFLKLAGNATYGIFGSEKKVPDMYLPAVAASTASYGRAELMFTLQESEKRSLPVLYGDTDSLFYKSGDTAPLKELVEYVRKTRGVELDWDKDFRFVILWKKKHYYAVTPEGQVIVKGMTGEKYHICAYIHKVWEKVKEEIGKIKTPEDYQVARKAIGKIVKTAFSELKLGKWELKDLVFSVKLDKNMGSGQDYLVAKQYNEVGLRKVAGDFIYKVFTKGEHSAKPFELTKPEEVDVEKYVEHLRGVLEQILEPLGVGLQGILSDYAPLTNFQLEIKFEGDPEPPPKTEEVILWWQ